MKVIQWGTGGSPGGLKRLVCMRTRNELLGIATIGLSQKWKMPFTKHYLEQISYHTLMFTKETEGERAGRNRFPRGGNCNENK